MNEVLTRDTSWVNFGKKNEKSQGRGIMAQLAIHPLQALGSYMGTDHIPDAAFPIQLSIYGLGKE